MIAFLRVEVVRALGLVVLFFSGIVHAQSSSVKEQARHLAEDQDFLVRTQAAFALGASRAESALAVKALCGGLADKQATVRAAAAAALGKLRRGGADCLRDRLAQEKSPPVRTVIERSLAKVEAESDAASGSGTPEVTAATRGYVAIDMTVVNGSRPRQEVHRLIRGAMIEALKEQGGFAVAPEGETKAQYNKRFGGKSSVRGFLLAPTVKEPSYTDGSLVIRVEMAIFTYPDKSLKGMLPVKLTQQGVGAKDRAAEDELLRMAAARAIEKFVSNLERIQ